MIMLMIPLMVIKIVHDYVNDFTLDHIYMIMLMFLLMVIIIIHDYVDDPAHGNINSL